MTQIQYDEKADKLLSAFNLPEDLTGKTVLEINRENAQITDALTRRGASVYTIGSVNDKLANTPDIKFDYVFLLHEFNYFTAQKELIIHIRSLLKDDGSILLEILQSKIEADFDQTLALTHCNIICPSDTAIRSWFDNATITVYATSDKFTNQLIKRNYYLISFHKKPLPVIITETSSNFVADEIKPFIKPADIVFNDRLSLFEEIADLEAVCAKN